jgi:hypothetical protein
MADQQQREDREEQREDREARIDLAARALANFLKGPDDCIAWIGSGLSIDCGYPSWEEAIRQLCDACIEGKADIQPSLVADDMLEWAEQCKRANPKEYIRTLGRLFGDSPHVIRTTYSHVIAHPFRFLLTTNFDPCLEMACGPNNSVIAYPDMSLLAAGHHTSVYLHGKARWSAKVDAANLVLAKSEFDKAYSPQRSLLPGALQQLVVEHRILFIGCRLQENILKETFQRIKRIQQHLSRTPLKKKMILLPDPKDNQQSDDEEQYMASLGIEILRYPLHDVSDHHQSASPHRLLDDIWERVGLRLREQSDPFNQKGGLPS